VVRQILPGTGNARHLRLTAKISLGAHLPGDAGDFGSEGIELIHHRVDGVFQLKDFALHIDCDLLGEVARGDRGRHLGNVAALAGEVLGHRVDVVGQILPGAANALHVGLATELALGAHFAGDARDFRSEGIELIHHRIDGVLQLEDFTLHIDGDLLGKVARGDGGRDFRDVAHLAGQIIGHQVDVVGEVLPGAADAFHAGLAAELAFGAHLARDTRHFRAEGSELADHGVDDLADAQEFAAQRASVDLDLHGLGEVALGDRADDARDLGGGLDEILDQLVDRAQAGLPIARGVADPAALAHAAFLADDAAEPAELGGDLAVELDDLIEVAGNLGVEALAVIGQAYRKIASPEGAHGSGNSMAVKVLALRERIHGYSPPGPPITRIAAQQRGTRTRKNRRSSGPR